MSTVRSTAPPATSPGGAALGGLETLRRYGRPWFSLLGRRRWGRASAEALDRYRAELSAKAGVA